MKEMNEIYRKNESERERDVSRQIDRQTDTRFVANREREREKKKREGGDRINASTREERERERRRRKNNERMVEMGKTCVPNAVGAFSLIVSPISCESRVHSRFTRDAAATEATDERTLFGCTVAHASVRLETMPRHTPRVCLRSRFTAWMSRSDAMCCRSREACTCPFGLVL